MCDKITRLGDIKNDGRMLTPLDQLKCAIKDIEDGNINPDKILILSLESKDGYHTTFHQAGMSMSECIALCEVAKTLFLSEMDYL